MTFVCVNVCVIINFGEYKQNFFVRSVTIRGGVVFLLFISSRERVVEERKHFYRLYKLWNGKKKSKFC